MSTPIIVMGANGRMGRTICTLVQELVLSCLQVFLVDNLPIKYVVLYHK